LQQAYLEEGVDYYIDFLDEVPSTSQIKKDARALYGALLKASKSGEGRRILMKIDLNKTGFAHGVSEYNNMRQMAMGMLELRNLRMLLLWFSFVIIKVV
jgi:hypothetical protein